MAHSENSLNKRHAPKVWTRAELDQVLAENPEMVIRIGPSVAKLCKGLLAGHEARVKTDTDLGFRMMVVGPDADSTSVVGWGWLARPDALRPEDLPLFGELAQNRHGVPDDHVARVVRHVERLRLDAVAWLGPELDALGVPMGADVSVDWPLWMRLLSQQEAIGTKTELLIEKGGATRYSPYIEVNGRRIRTHCGRQWQRVVAVGHFLVYRDGRREEHYWLAPGEQLDLEESEQLGAAVLARKDYTRTLRNILKARPVAA